MIAELAAIAVCIIIGGLAGYLAFDHDRPAGTVMAIVLFIAAMILVPAVHRALQ